MSSPQSLVLKNAMIKKRKPRVVLVTGHYWYSKRRAGFHWLADAFHRLGWEVLFFTASLSWLSYVRRDHRLRYPSLWKERNRLIPSAPGFFSYVWFTPYHPANLRSNVLNHLSKALFARYGDLPLGPAEEWIRSADLIVFESTPGLLLFHRFKRLNPGARFVYRASDDLRLLKNHPLVLEMEKVILPEFDLVSVPSAYMYQLFRDKTPRLRLHFHAIRKDLFDRDYPNPYLGLLGPHLVFVGVSHFDYDFLERASRIFPNARFHIVGPIQAQIKRPNVHFYGERPFSETIPYIKFADVGLANRTYAPGAESLSDSLKIIQYTYARLPIVAPEFLRSSRCNVIPYRPGEEESIKRAITKALETDRSSIDVSDIYSWEELAQRLVEE